MNWSQQTIEYLSKGESLKKIGVNNWALDKLKAMDALNFFERNKVSVLGGDVYQKIDGVIQSNYDNWFCNSKLNESDSQFIKRSIAEAISYIENYSNNSEIYFALIPSS